MTNEERIQKIKKGVSNKNRKKTRATVVLVFIIISLILGFALYSPLFNINSIEVSGMGKLSREYIISVSGVSPGNNIFKMSASRAASRIEAEPYVESAKVSRKLPDQIHISVTERTPIGKIFYMGSYVLFDKNGVALEVASEVQNKNLIDVKGLEFSKFTLGQPIVRSDSEELQTALNILTLLPKDDLLMRIGYINVENSQKVSMYVDNRFDVNLGSSEELKLSGLCKHRLIFLEGIINNEQLEGRKGHIDLTGDKPRFRPY